MASHLRGGRKRDVCREFVVQRPYHGNLKMPHLMRHRQPSGLDFLCRAVNENWILEESVRDTFSSFTITPPVSGVERRRKHQNYFSESVERHWRSFLSLVFFLEYFIGNKWRCPRRFFSVVGSACRRPNCALLTLSFRLPVDWFGTCSLWLVVFRVGWADFPVWHRCDLCLEETASLAFNNLPLFRPNIWYCGTHMIH